MEHWQVSYLGIRQIPRELTEFDLATFFTFSAKERALIEARRGDLYRLAVALHIGFIRMSGRTLDAYKQVPKVLWNHLGAQLVVDPPDLGTLRTLYETRARTLIDHQVLAYQALGFRPMAEHQRRYVVRWLKERLTGRPERGDLLYELKRWLYEHHILIVHDRLLKRLIVKAGQDVEGSLTDGLVGAFGDATLDHWSRLLAQPDNDHASLQQWLWAVPLRQSTHQMGDVFTKIDRLYAIGVHEGWPMLCNDAAVRHYARRCARRPPAMSKRIEQRSRRLEAACFMRYALCSATDQLLSMLRRWIRKVVNDATREVESIQIDPNARLQEFASAVKTVALDVALAREELSRRLCELADQTLDQRMPSRRSLVRARLLAKRGQARAMLARFIRLPFEAQTVHPVINALDVLRDLYARKGYLLPDRVVIRLGRAWREAIDSYDRYKALLAFEWATLFALRVALRNGSVFIDHSFAFRSQAMLLIPPDEWKAKRNHFYGHLKLPQDPKEFLGPLIEHLDQSLIVLRDATTRGDVHIDSAVHLDPLSAQTPNPAHEALRRAIFSVCPNAQLPEIILEVDSTTRFSWLLLGREPGSRAELLMVYAAVLAHGTSLTAADIARMVPELASAAIRQMMDRIADERKLRQAADAVLEFMHRHPIAAHWGRADLASSDMMSLETARTVWQARTDPRRRTASIGMYTHVRDRCGIFYDQPIVLNERQAGSAIEGVIRGGRQ